MCACYNTLVKSYTVAEIRVAAKLARGQLFGTVDHFMGWMQHALKNQAKGKGSQEAAWIEARKGMGPPNEIGFRELVTMYFICGKGLRERGPFRTYAEAERAMGEK